MVTVVSRLSNGSPVPFYQGLVFQSLIRIIHDYRKSSSQGAEEFARSFASSFTLCTATHIDVRAIPLSVWRRIAASDDKRSARDPI